MGSVRVPPRKETVSFTVSDEKVKSDARRLLTAVYILAGGRAGVVVDMEQARQVASTSTDEELNEMSRIIRDQKLRQDRAQE
jgi:hypothetical protein